MKGYGRSLVDMTFEELLDLCKPRIDFNCHHFCNFLKDLDYDDLYQILSIKLWELWKGHKFPHDIFDFRTTRYIDKAFKMEIYQQRKMRIPRGQYMKKIYVFKDLYYKCEELNDGHL